MADTNLIYIGSHFYTESGTVMSCLYTEYGSERYDWGLVETDLRSGKEVSIRPATDAEYGRYERALRAIKADRA